MSVRTPVVRAILGGFELEEGGWELALFMVAHGCVVTSSRQITEVKQRRAQLVLGWVTAARVMLSAMYRGVGQAFHIMPPLSTQQ